MPRPAAERRAELIALYHELHESHGCPLAATRTNLVFGTGEPDADLMFVGEAPGQHEDIQGKPFVGRAGKLLDELLGEIGFQRRQVFIANCLMCRPPGNRDPLPDEIAECEPYLRRKIELIEPRVICTLGNFATKLLTGRRDGIMKVRGRPQVHTIAGRAVRLYPLCHPAAALRTPAVLQTLREDFSRIPDLLAEPLPELEATPEAAEDAPEVSAEQLGLFA
jgi:uracil-DNA glycosylase